MLSCYTFAYAVVIFKCMHVCVGVMTAVWERVVMLYDYYDAPQLVRLF